MTVPALATRDTASHRRTTWSDAVVPPASPPWFGAVMGSAILGTLCTMRSDVLPAAHALAAIFWLISVALLVGLVSAFAVRVVHDRTVFRESVRTVVACAQWGLVAMGMLAVGSATAAVLPTLDVHRTALAWHVDAALWLIGTAIGVTAALAVTVRLIAGSPGTPTTIWGLAVVPPMVSATVGGGLVGWFDATQTKVWLLVVSVACFVLALVLGGVIFAIAYRHHWLVEDLPLAASISAWLPLGIVGQSTAASQTIAHQAAGLLLPSARPAVHHVANMFGVIMLGVGVPLVLWALAMTVRGFRAHMPFNPGWWGMTFPVGTLVLGSTLLGRTTGSGIATTAGGVLLVFLLLTWTTCAVSSVAAVSRRAAAR